MKPGERWYLNLDLVHEATNGGADGTAFKPNCCS